MAATSPLPHLSAKMMKRKASSTDLEYQSPPQCGFSNEEGYAKREFERLPGQEQERVMRDIYGIEEDVDENPLFVKEILHALDYELALYMNKSDALVKLKMQGSVLDDDELRLKFLRAEEYNAKFAARRIVKHFEKKLELFGLEKIGKRIDIGDLDHDDLETLRCGGFQPLGSRDRGGRVCIFERLKNVRFKSSCNLFRVIWFVSMAVIEDCDEATNGLVLVSFQNGPFSPDLFDRVVYKQMINIMKRLLPLKLAGYHFCFDDIRFRMVWGLATIYIGKDARLRARDHEGTLLECRYGLMSYGLPVDELPITVDGDDDNTSFLEWIECRGSKENDPDSAASEIF